MRRLKVAGRLAGDLFRFVKHDNLWWMSPVLVILLMVGTLLIVVEGSALAPLIYAMF